MNAMTAIFLNNLNGIIIIILVLVLIVLVGLVVVPNENMPKLFPKKRPIVSMQ